MNKELSEESKKQIEEARERIKKSEFVTEADAIERLGLKPKGKEINFPDMETAEKFIKQMKRQGVKEMKEKLLKYRKKLELHSNNYTKKRDFKKAACYNTAIFLLDEMFKEETEEREE